MNCSCGYVNQYLAPCQHIFAVLADMKHVTADLFHIRWWKHFNYYFASPDKLKANTNIHKGLVVIHNVMRKSCGNVWGRSGSSMLKYKIYDEIEITTVAVRTFYFMIRLLKSIFYFPAFSILFSISMRSGMRTPRCILCPYIRKHKHRVYSEIRTTHRRTELIRAYGSITQD